MDDEAANDDVMEPGRWRRNGWEAKVVRNDEGEGWAVEMRRTGDEEPALVGPWTMGRDKKNPKPLDQGAFSTLVKTASEVMRRHEQQAYAARHRSFSYTRGDRRVRAALALAGDEDETYGELVCTDEVTGETLRAGRVSPRFKLDATSVDRFLGDL